MLMASVGLASLIEQAFPATELKKGVRQTVTVYTASQRTWDRNDTAAGSEGPSVGDIAYFTSAYFSTPGAARAIETLGSNSSKS